MNLYQRLALDHPEFFKKLRARGEVPDPDLFPSHVLTAHVIFSRYYLQGRTPKKSDLGDLMHVYALPYCR